MEEWAKKEEGGRNEDDGREERENRIRGRRMGKTSCS
jgi:hypothetical protein